jgi:hypothetical protein
LRWSGLERDIPNQGFQPEGERLLHGRTVDLGMGGEKGVDVPAGVEMLEQRAHRDLGAREHRPVPPFRRADDHLVESPHAIPPVSRYLPLNLS